MNFAKYFFKKILLTLLGVLVTITISYFVIVIFINNQNGQPIIKNYFKFLISIFNGFGKPLLANNSGFKSSLSLFFHYYKFSLLFVGISFVFSFFIGVLVGIWLGYKNNKFSDLAISFIVFILAAVPTFIFAPIMLIISEINDLPVNFVEPSAFGFGFTLLSLMIPISLLSLGIIAFFTTITKSNLVQILKKDYVITLKANGLNSWKIFQKAVIKNLFISIINQIVPILVLAISFSLIIELIFQIPGQSIILISMFEQGEINVIMALVFFKTLLLFILAFICELIYDILQVENGYNFYFNLNIKDRIAKIKFRKGVHCVK
ncbi:ABC transporter permease [Mycoplasmopsis caviae]|uniref:ABC transporter permease n=1 Tax=Mycoplasmopsis caviae TaxID=55603 RepID=A0A3P8L6N5_9BACT|nr:ABC transporter permease [Mycoplasmopsis caviae]UUD35574.1 ABC transporter permease [Mycoplasmopsis caviae]VDR41655.1 oligopeptide ABC transporter permease [Mycoplasmopsis caviae]